jgi:endonuclease YncB( thermonuclease family)
MTDLSTLQEQDCIHCIPVKDNQIVKALRVIDGDTIELGFIVDGIAQKMPLRMAMYDACEIHSTDPVERQHAEVAKSKLQEICEGKLIQLKTVKLDKYARLLCDASVGNIQSISEYMLQFTDCCVPYTGGKKKPWLFSEAVSYSP